MPRNNQPNVTGDLTSSAPGLRVTGLFGSAVPGLTGTYVTGKPMPRRFAVATIQEAVDALASALQGPPPSDRTALIGDSLTTAWLGYNWSPAYWANGLNGGVLKIVANAGISGNTVADMLARVDNLYTAATPGLAGLGTLGRIIARFLTNDARANTAWSGVSSNVNALIAKLKSYCTGKVIILSVPPVGPSEANYAVINARTIEYNTQLAALCASDPRLMFVDDSAGLRNGDGSQKSGYFNPDGIHNDGRATYVEGLALASALASELAGYPSPVSTSSADVYPAQPQWNDNHLMTGSVASGGFSGQVATGYGIGGYGSGFSGLVYLSAADSGDTNTTPWQWVEPTAVAYTGAGEAIVITKGLVGRTITSGDPVDMDIVVEVRFDAFDTNYFKWSRIQLMGGTSSQPLFADLDLKMGGEIITHNRVVKRIAMPRIFAASESGLSVRWEWATRSAFSGSMGRFGFRCLTARG